MKLTHVEPMPRGLAALLRFVERAMVQPGVQEVRILTKGVEVVREMPEGEEVVVPKGTDDIDFDFLLGKIELLTHPFSEEEHGTEALFLAAQTLQTTRKVRPQWLILPGWPLASAWLGLKPAEQPKSVYGYQAVFVQPSVTNGRAILLGAADHYRWMSDATVGIAVDMGI